MAETDDDVRPLALGGHLDPVAVAKVARKVLLILTPAIAALAAAVCGAIYSVAGGAQAKAAYAKNAAEAGYQETRHAVEELQGRVGELQRPFASSPPSSTPPRAGGAAPVPPPPCRRRRRRPASSPSTSTRPSGRSIGGRDLKP